MRLFTNMSLRWKQRWIIMLTCGLALALACAAFVTYDAFSFRREIVERVTSLAEVVGKNTTAAIDFNDAAAAEQTLTALQGEASIVMAHVQTSGDVLFASYRREGTALPPEIPHALQAHHEFTANHLHLFRPITQGGEQIGTIELVASLDEFRQRLWRYAGIVAAVFATALLVAFWLSAALGRIVSGPIVHLAAVARAVAQEKNYSARATKGSNDELGQLVDGFNEMLAEIQERDFALQAARDTLEHSVRERTAELAGTNQALQNEVCERERAQSFLDSVVEHLPIPVFIKEAKELRFVLWNQAGEKLTGISNAEMIGKNDFDFFPQADAERNVAKDRAAFAGQGVLEIPEEIIQTREHGARFVHVWKVPIFDASGQPAFLLGIAEDITERKRAEITALAFSKLGRQLSCAASPEAASRIISEISDELFGWDACSIQVYSAADDTVRCILEIDTFEHQRINTTNTNPRKITALHRRIFKTGAELILRDATTFLPEAAPFGNRSRPSASLMYVPIRTATEIVGILSVQSYSPNAYTEQNLTTLQTLADQCSGALQRLRADEALRESESQFRLVWDTSVDGMRLADRDGTVLLANDAYCRMVDKTKAEIEGQSLAVIHAPDRAELILHNHRQRVDSPDDQTHLEVQGHLWNGRTVWFEMSNSKLTLPGHPPLLLSIFRDVTERKQSELELDNLHRQLLGVSRQAGMAEVATNVLHNVGNVLNSVNISVSVLADRLRDSQVKGVTRVTELLETHRHDLAGFLTAKVSGASGQVSGPDTSHLTPGTGTRADQVINYLKTLTEHLGTERAQALSELQELAKNVDHIKEIVVMQQSYAKVSGLTEQVKPTDLVEDALRMNVGALARHQVELVREYAPGMPEILVEKHKVLQILINLIRNAKYACDDSNLPDKCLTLRVAYDPTQVRITVADNGVGIAPENLTRIFSHGFTTRKEGHGFGLHSGALAARELGGKLSVHSAGSGRGAEFTLELPFHPPGMAGPAMVVQAELEPEEAHVLV